MRRVHQVILITSLLAASWLGMQAIHEFGHVLGAWFTRGRVVQVVLHPLTISRTDLAENPSPLVVVWAGPLLGCAVPLVFWGVANGVRWSFAFLLRFFAGFCLLSNGAYIAVGSLDGIGDAGTMLRHGCPAWLLWSFGALTIPSGLWLWHGQGPSFGLGAASAMPRPMAAYICLAAFTGLLVMGLAMSGR